MALTHSLERHLTSLKIDDQLAAVFCVLNENIRLTVDMEVSVCLAK
ncbi:hypothetical protein BACCAC_03926 [Bacteroides caccae ATCC 43185]|nr:hypothetical protein BACCAC_03926 [Bacteroides caccae ATCC 43185]